MSPNENPSSASAVTSANRRVPASARAASARRAVTDAAGTAVSANSEAPKSLSEL